MDSPASNNPTPSPDISTLIAKHGGEINRILALDSRGQQEESLRYGLTPEVLLPHFAELQGKDSELRKKGQAAGKKTALLGFGAGIIAGISAFIIRNNLNKNRVVQAFIVAASFIGAGLGFGWLGSKLFGGKIREESNALTEQAKSIFVSQLAIAIENTQRAQHSAARTQEAEAIHRILGGFISQAAVDLGVLSTAQQVQVLEIQSRYVAFTASGKRLETGHGWELLDDAKWQQIAAQNGIDAAKLEAARKTVMAGGGIPKEQAPASGDIAVQLGFIPREVKNALLTAQAAERSLQAATPGNYPTENFARLIASDKWQRIGDPRDPVELQAAQAVNFLAETLSAAAREAGASLSPDAAQKIEYAKSALVTLSIASFENAAVALGSTPVGERIAFVAAEAANRQGKETGLNKDQIKRALDIVEVGLAAAGNSIAQWPTQQIQEKMTLARTGLEQLPPGRSPQIPQR